MFLCYIVDIENGNPEAGPGNESWSGRIIYAGEVPVRRHRLWPFPARTLVRIAE